MAATFPTSLDPLRLKAFYEWSEWEYFAKLPLEHFMESVPHATQRKITLESFDLINAHRPDVQCFNELLIQYPRPGGDPKTLGQVVPDNMVVIHGEPIVADGSFNTPFQPVGPFLLLEYISKASRSKDFVDNLAKYEHDLEVPYYLLFDPEEIELTLYRLEGDRYEKVRPVESGRYPISEIEVEVALHGGWVRYWFRGELVPLPAELLQDRDAKKMRLAAAEADRDANKLQLAAAEADRDANKLQLAAAEAEIAKLREELARLKTKP